MDYREEFLKQIIVLDTETTSKDFNVAEVVELGYVVRGVGMEPDWLLSSELFKPVEPMSAQCSAVTNISNKMLKDKRPYTDAATETQDLLGAFGKDGIGVAHNAIYDRTVLGRYGNTMNTWLCTLRLFRKLYHGDTSVEAHNLPYLRYRFEILDPADSDGTNAHRADADAHVTALLLEHALAVLEIKGIVDPLKPYWPQIDRWLNEPIIYTTMPFGKYKDQELVDVPASYWSWAVANLDVLDKESPAFDPDFNASVELALEKIL